MTLATTNFTTGSAVTLITEGHKLSYNGCSFSPLYVTTVSGNAIKDEARRTVMYVEYIITVDGYVTLPVGATSITPAMENLRKLLTAQGGHLIYEGRGLELNINSPGAGILSRDVAWGPVPELLEFQPLGGGRSAKIQWTVTVRIPEVAKFGGKFEILQFSYETVVGYGEDGYSNLSVRGILEIPLTRRPNQGTRTLTKTADDLRFFISERLSAGMDLTRFRVTRRNFNLSRDKRVLVWDFALEEKPYMDLPPDCPVARGSYSVRPARAGMGLVSWLCTLRATYTVRRDKPRRTAWLAFLALLRHRMAMSENAPEVTLDALPAPNIGLLTPILAVASPGYITGLTLKFLVDLLKAQNPFLKDKRRALLCDFNINEGLYLDSKTVTFSATWRLVSPFSHILLASGVWTKVAEEDATKKNVWALSMKDVQGHNSWEVNRVDPKLDVIVDFGGP